MPKDLRNSFVRSWNQRPYMRTKDAQEITRFRNLVQGLGILCQEDPVEKEIATHSSVLAWKIPWAEEPGGH